MSESNTQSHTYTRFMITGNARTGSNMLVQALNSNPAVRCFREVFHSAQEFVDFSVEGYDKDSPDDLALRNDDPIRFLETRILCDHPGQFRAVGFKYLYGHFWGQDPLTEHLRADPELLVIHLKRRNALRLLVSVRLAEATNKWLEESGTAQRRPFHVRAASAAVHPVRTVQRLRRKLAQPPPEPKPRLTFTKEELHGWFYRANHEVTRVDAMFSSHKMLDVYYEDMLADRDRAFTTVQEFIGVAPQKLEVSLRRQNPEPLRDLIANYDELRTAFAGTPEERFFET